MNLLFFFTTYPSSVKQFYYCVYLFDFNHGRHVYNDAVVQTYN